jgi:hypothetical protein
MGEEGQEQQEQDPTPHKRKFSLTLEQAQQLVAMFGVAVALGTGIFAAWSFHSSSNTQAEDAAYRVLSEHMTLRLEQSKDLDDPNLIDRLAVHPEYLNNPGRVSNSDFAIYKGVAANGLMIAEQLFRTRGDKEPWRSTAKRLIWDYRALIFYGKLDCDTYEPEFLEFISETLQTTQRKFCGVNVV